MSVHFQIQLSQIDTFPCVCENDNACRHCNGKGNVTFTNDIAEFYLGNSRSLRVLRGDVTPETECHGSRQITLQDLTSVLHTMAPLPIRIQATLHFLSTVCTALPTKLTVHWS